MKFTSADLASQLARKNQELARENAVLREKCRLLEHKMQKLEKVDVDIYPEKVRSEGRDVNLCNSDLC
jgi:hypothetical protein